jgi:small subunit ribosomal protein S9
MEEEIKTESQKMKGRYLRAIGRRKRAVAEARIYKKGSGVITVNDKKAVEYFNADHFNFLIQPLKLTKLQREFNISIKVKGGGIKAQADAARHALAKALVMHDALLKPSLRAKGWITRDDRKVERKKPGLKKARRAPQWSKR